MSQTPAGPSPQAAAAQVQTWERSTLHARVTGGFGAIPALLTQALPQDGGIAAAPAHWHCALYGDLVLGKVGTSFTAGDCYAALRRHDLSWRDSAAGEALCAFLGHLKKAGHLTFEQDSAGRPAGPVRVIADLRTLPTRQPTEQPTALPPSQASGKPADAAAPLDAAPGGSQAPAHTDRPDPAAAPAPTTAPTTAVTRVARTAAEASWLHGTTKALALHGVHGPAAEALIAMARWGSPVLVEPAAA